MWGDAEGAYSLTTSDKLAKCLFQVTGPTHVPYHDSKWQQLLLNYEKLVHLHNLRRITDESVEDNDDDVVGNACRRCAKYSSTSSNLAALSLHVARMIRDLQQSIVDLTKAYHEKYSALVASADEANNEPEKQSGSSTTKQRISLIGKARATCGAIHVLRLFSHETILGACRSETAASANENIGSIYYEGTRQSALEHDVNYILRESFTYRSRDLNGLDGRIDGQDAAMDLISSIMSFLSALGTLMSQDGENVTQMSRNFDALLIPEVYDVVVQILSLLLVFLSTQLYQPMVSSAQLAEGGQTTSKHYFLERIMDYAYWQRQNVRQNLTRPDDKIGGQKINGSAASFETSNADNEPLWFLFSCFQWLIRRPKPPRRSIALHHVELTYSIVQQLHNMAVAPDGMYENHSIVMATVPAGQNINAPDKPVQDSAPFAGAQSHGSAIGSNEEPNPTSAAISLGTDDDVILTSPGHVSGEITTRNSSSSLLLPIRSILLLSSSLFLLPIRLVRLAFRILGHSSQRVLLGSKSPASNHDISTSDHSALQHLQTYCEKASGWDKTNNILWMTDSPVADLASALILLLSNNCRTNLESGRGSDRRQISSSQNPFRLEMATLNDNRWVGEMAPTSTRENSLLPCDNETATSNTPSVLSINFESLFESFGRILHTEVGALMLYTVMQSSPVFAASLMARSDLDTLVVPLLRTLYFSSKLSHETGDPSRFITLSDKDRPFRAQSQLYVILILLLIFSQDPSFGRDSFRRVSIPKVKWYKERHVKEVSLGSMIILVLIKAITFNLNRLQDEFLLSNCCAVLLNLSPHIVNIHAYVASRLVSVTVSCFKRYATLLSENNGEAEVEGDLSSPLGMHGETLRTLLQLIKHSIRPKCVDNNLQLVYAILLEEVSFQKICDFAPLQSLDTTSIIALIKKADHIIQGSGSGASAEEIMKVMKSSTEWKTYLEAMPRTRTNSFDSFSSDASDLGNLTFTYEEESDPEIFFVPYIWDVIVGSLTASTFEWARNKIQVFSLNHDDAVSSYYAHEFGIDGMSETKASEYDSREHTPDVV
ncbi:hypothetical protein HJC23_002403 [Cyclotella cryptica]|uniref:Dymeclin n=1 Tax=Cyclotella cryptica TaxID=29204 RepID=A0ABD3QLF8_9STRA|eukprot:CCRYP_004517-RA/>CCRYP_004517-RA protein AED:0.04 eAED:0.04 QI:2374/1/1/1/0.66/0.57/7/191/1056